MHFVNQHTQALLEVKHRLRILLYDEKFTCWSQCSEDTNTPSIVTHVLELVKPVTYTMYEHDGFTIETCWTDIVQIYVNTKLSATISIHEEILLMVIPGKSGK